MKASYSGRPISWMPLSFRFWGSVPASSPACSWISARASAGPSEERLRAALPGAAFLGFRDGDELARIYASLDVFVHTGPSETFCQAVQEALAAGVPAVVAASGGPLDLVRHRENGWLWAGDDPQVLAAMVAGLRDDPATLQAAAAAARPSVAGRTWGRIGDELIGPLQRLRTAVPAAATR